MSESVAIIAHVLHRLCPAGAEVLAADLARRLKGGYRFVFFCLDETGSLGQQLKTEGFDVVELGRKPGVDLATSRRLAEASRRYGVRLIHAHQYTPFFYAALSRWCRSVPPILFTEHGRHYPDRRRMKRVLANRFLFRRFDRITAVGQSVKQALVDHEGLNENLISVIPNGIHPDDFFTEDRQQTRLRLRTEIGVGPDQPMVLQVARLHPVKDHATAVAALARVVAHEPEVVLVLAGDGQQRRAIEAQAKQLGVAENLRLLGVRNDIPALMAAADLMLLSSLSEGLSVTLLEAMAAGLPIVATDVGGNPEVVIHGETGLLSPRGQPGPLAQHVLTLLHDSQQRRRMGRAGRQRLDREFTQQRMHQAYSGLYQQMLQQPVSFPVRVHRLALDTSRKGRGVL